MSKIINKDETSLEIEIEEGDHDTYQRLDHLIHKNLHHLGHEEVSRSALKKWFESGLIDYEGPDKKIELKKVPSSGILKIVFPKATSSKLEAKNLKLEVLYEDEHLFFINKPVGLVVHPGAGNRDLTLCHGLLYLCPQMAQVGHPERPGIVHRLDKGTSGVMVIAKTEIAYQKLVKIFQDHNLTRRYQALSIKSGQTPPLFKERTIETLFGRHPRKRTLMTSQVSQGKKAITHVKVIDEKESLVHFELTLETGRTHQIRVHLSEVLHCPIMNDPTYGRAKGMAYPNFLKHLESELRSYEHPFLHAKYLELNHPISGKHLVFQSNPPAIFQRVLNAIVE